MIIKHRTKPRDLEMLEAAIPRLLKSFPKLEEMQKDTAILYKGYIGEQKVDYHLNILANKYTILQDVRLLTQGRSIQFDTIVIANNAIFAIEIKNVSGKITFDTILRQFIRNDGTTEEGFRYPITQAETQKLLLQNWLNEHNFHNIPVHYFIAISEPSTIIDVKGDHEAIAKVVAHAEHIPQMIVNIDRHLKNRTNLPARQIGETILHHHRNPTYDIFRKYNLKKTDILPGIICPKCTWLGMHRIHSLWHCPKCNHPSRHAHKSALADYFLLIKPWITNTECMKFLKVNSRHTIKRILKSSNVTCQQPKRIWISNTTHK